ncbi:MAG: hypothetical protein ACT4P8_19430 [Betaproteobacteria bacterium]
MTRIPDPRRYGKPDDDDPVGVLIERNAGGDAEAQHALLAWLRDCLERGSDESIFQALRQIPSPIAYRKFWDLINTAASGSDDVAVAVRPFAFPIVMVTGARTAAVVPGALPDVEAIRALFERHGAVGPTRNFGLSNALCSAQALERLKPSLVLRWSRQWSDARRELPPAAIPVPPGREQVHLRFLAGAGIAPREAPSFLETASCIGAWGMAVTRELGRQLAQPAVDLIAIPRAPVDILRASHAGRCAELEVAFNVFVSNTLRQFRSAVGDPAVVISAHRHDAGTAELRVSMSCVMDDTLLEGFRWPLHPLDDLDAIQESISTLLRDCRVRDVCVVEAVLPDRLASGRLFLHAHEEGSRAAARH